MEQAAYLSFQAYFHILLMWMWYSLPRMIIGILVGVAIIVFGIIAYSVATGLEKEEASQLAGVAGNIVGTIVGFWAGYHGFKRILGKTYSGYRLVLYRDQP